MEIAALFLGILGALILLGSIYYIVRICKNKYSDINGKSFFLSFSLISMLFAGILLIAIPFIIN